jgi:hypothetical protein
VTRIEGRWTRDDRVDSLYQYVPFEVPAGTRAVRVVLEYSGGVLDLGCFGPGGEFRGWSGGARDRFVIAADAATPGYLPGPVEAGEWHVALGLHRVPVDGMPYTLTIEAGDFGPDPLPPAPPAPDRPPRRELPGVDGMRWFAGDLHTHTLHSDGALSLEGLAELVVSRGLDFCAVTDHNTVSHHPHLPGVGARYGVALLPGQEVTTAYGHANAFGDIGWVDFRRPADEWLAHAAGNGGLLSVNHPLADDCGWRQPMTGRPHLAEVWHWSWIFPTWTGPLAWWEAAGRDITPVGGSDWHRPGDDSPPGEPTTWVLATDAGPDAILAGLHAGRTAVSAHRGAPLLLRLGDEFVALDADGALLVSPEGRRTPVRGDRATLPAAPGPHLLETPDGARVALAG